MNIRRYSQIGVLLFLATCIGWEVQGTAETPLPEPIQTDVFLHGDGGVPVYRIPSLLTTPRGTLLAFAEARHGSGEDHEHIEVVLRRSNDDGATWSPTQVVAKDGPHAVQNPTVVVDRKVGRIWLVLIRTDTVRFKTWKDISKSKEPARRVWILFSDDDGVSWSTPRDITDAVCSPKWRELVPGPGVGIQTSSGRLIIPSYCVSLEDSQARAVMIYSDDRGQTWQSGNPTDASVTECQVVELEDQELLLNMRDERRTGYRAVSRSHDGGLNWSPIEEDHELVDPVCQASLIRYTASDGCDRSRLLFSNPARKGFDDRRNLTIRMSYDEGETWPVSRALWQDCSMYSCLTVLLDQSIGCLYERGPGERFDRITFARFTLDWLSRGEDRIPKK